MTTGLRLLKYYQQTLAAPDTSPVNRAIASAGLRALLRHYKPGKRLTVIRVDTLTVPAGALRAGRYELAGD